MIIVNSLLSIHYLCSEHHLLVVTVTRVITTTQWWLGTSTLCHSYDLLCFLALLQLYTYYAQNYANLCYMCNSKYHSVVIDNVK